MDIKTKQRTLSHQEKILNILRENKENGVTNAQLQEIALRYNARIQELYQKGYVIQLDKSDNGLSTYKLISEPVVERKELPSAIEILTSEIKSHGNRITSDQLQDMLDNLNLTVKRKLNTVKKTVFNT